MENFEKFEVGQIVTFKKKHPCGSTEWEITRTGADFKVVCKGCGRELMLTSIKFKKCLKK